MAIDSDEPCLKSYGHIAVEIVGQTHRFAFLLEDTNKPKCFQNSQTVETGLSDCHKMTISVMKTFIRKQVPRIISYRDYKKFDNVKM